MYKLSIQSVKPGMVLYDDLYGPQKTLLYRANTVLTQKIIQTLCENNYNELTLSEPDEINLYHYKYLHTNPHFKQFVKNYTQAFDAYRNIMRTLGTGLDLNLTKLLSLRDDVFSSVFNSEQLIDYLYNMMPNESEITYHHCFNCGILCYIFGKWLNMQEDDLDTLTMCGFIFDIGKAKLPDSLIWKPDKLTPEEFRQVQRHIHLGYEQIRTRQFPPHVVTVLIMHHERCDGSGYPAGLTQDRIDPYALIAAIADTYEAMTHPRAQRTALTPFQAIRAFEKQGFKKYGPNTKLLLKHIAQTYLERRVCMTGNLEGRITEIHDEALSKPTVFVNDTFIDLRKNPETEIIRMI